MIRLTSRQHPLVQRCRQIAAGRGATGDVLLDGDHLCLVALESGVVLDAILTSSPDTLPAPLAAARDIPVYDVTASVMDAASPVRTPSGLIAIARWSPAPLETIFADPPGGLVLALVDVQDPGNVGTIIRSADALHGGAVLALGETSAPGGWKALRAAMGGTFRLPIAVGGVDVAIDAAQKAGWRIAATVARDGIPLDAARLGTPTLLLLGREGSGLAPAVVDKATDRLTIPMRAGVDSLNVATAAALCLYEAQRQHRGREKVVM